MILEKLLVLASFWTYGSAIIGYNCGTNSLNITTVSLLDIDKCEIETNKIETAVTSVFVLQINEYTETDLIQCKVEVRRTVHLCGMFSHVALVDNAYMEYIYTVSRETCEVAHKHGTLRIGNTIIDGLEPNTTTTRSITFAGSTTNSGTCTGAQYSDPFGTWNSVVVMGTARISLRAMTARVKIDDNKILLPSGLSYPLTKGHCTDPEGGHSFWRILPRNNCCHPNSFPLLYKGMATRIISTNEILCTVTQRTTSFTLTKQGVEETCGLKFVAAEHPKLFIIESTDENTIRRSGAVKLSIDNMDLFLYINTKFVYVERFIRRELEGLYKDILHHRCNLDRDILKNGLSIASVMPDEFAYRFMKSPGYMAVLAGGVIHIVQCVPIEVKVRQVERCYNRLPILQGNENAFLTSRTHIIVNQATELTCNSPLMQYYRLGNMWFKLMPRPVEALPPTNVKPNSKETWVYKSPEHLARSGIYTEEDLDKMRDRIMFPMENTAVLNEIAHKVSGDGKANGPPSMYNLFDENALDKLAANAWEKTWGRFMKLGTISAGFIGIFMIIRIGKAIVDTAIHGYTLHSVYGWSFHLVGAIWDSITNLLLHLARVDKKKITKSEPDLEAASKEPEEEGNQDSLYPKLTTLKETEKHQRQRDNFV